MLSGKNVLLAETQLKLKTDLSNNYMENGPILTDRKSIENGVRFSVDADNDVHISISKEGTEYVKQFF
jgi:hypothetical protein